MTLNISSKNNIPQESKVVDIVKSVCEKYDIPVFTQNVVIEKDVIPHSHPVLTLNTQVKDTRLLLTTLVHEQLHWYAQDHSQYNDCITYLKSKYQDDGEHNKSGTYPNSYWEHIIVCFNTRRYLKKVLSKEDSGWVYKEWQAYPTLEKLIVEKNDEIQADLEKFELILE